MLMGSSLNKLVIFNTFQTASGNKTGLPSVSPVIYPSYWAAGYDNSQKYQLERKKIGDMEHRITLYADDVILFCSNLKQTLPTLLELISVWCFCRLGLGEQSYIYDRAFWTFQFYSSTLPIYSTFSHYLHFSCHLKDRQYITPSKLYLFNPNIPDSCIKCKQQKRSLFHCMWECPLMMTFFLEEIVESGQSNR